LRIASLLPSATEIAFALGLGDQVVAVSHECDYPPEASNRPVLTKSAIHQKIHRSLEVDREVEQRSYPDPGTLPCLRCFLYEGQGSSTGLGSGYENRLAGACESGGDRR